MSPEDQAIRAKAIRVDLQLIADMIEPGARVLDVGCGDGTLLSHLVHDRAIDGRGIELSTDGVKACISMGLPVIQGDAESDLVDYPDGAFDYVVLSQTLQAMHRPKWVLEHLLRIGKHAIVSFPNFAHWRVRMHLGLAGRMPVNACLPLEWYETPNIHFCTIRDFVVLCDEMGISVTEARYLDEAGKVRPFNSTWFANLFAEQAVYLLKR